MICAVIVAGGSGSRMQAAVKKQYLQLGGMPIVGHTLMAFDRCADIDRMLLVVPEDDQERCRTTILAPLKLKHDVQLVAGGPHRQDSVRNGLSAVDATVATVMIHDGVRPFVRPELIAACIDGVAATGACIPAMPVTDTLKEIDDHEMVVATLDRSRIRLAQTPQTFDFDLIRHAHQMAVQQGFTATDDASVAEFAGARVTVVPGDRDNIKITTPEDLPVAQAILDTWH